MKALHMVTWILVVVGALNWGLDALGWNLVEKLLGDGTTLEKVVYYLVALSAVYEIATHKKNCKMCAGDGMGAASM